MPLRDTDTVEWMNRTLRLGIEECVEWPFNHHPKGYGLLRLNGRSWRANRYVCEQFHGEPPSVSYDAAHSCGNARCVNPSHLRWATKSENQADRIKHGTDHRGEKHPMAKLTEAQVLEMRHMRGVSNKDLAKKFEVTPYTAYQIMTRRSWRHI